jgi:hypothetical protein
VSDDRTLHLRPSSTLARLADHVDAWLLQVPEMERAASAGGVRTRDDGILRRALRVYGEMKDDAPLFAEQLRRWQDGTLSASQGASLAELATKLTRIRGAVDSLLARVVGLRGRRIGQRPREKRHSLA